MTYRAAAGGLAAFLCLIPLAHTTPPAIEAVPAWSGGPIPLPKLRPVPGGHAPPPFTTALATKRMSLAPATLSADISNPALADLRATLSTDSFNLALADLRATMLREVHGLLPPDRVWQKNIVARAQNMLVQTGHEIDSPQLILVVDRDPARQRLAVMLAMPAPEPWQMVGSVHVSTGQSGRKDYYITPIGAFSHTDAILDFRAAGTYNENHVRGLGTAGMRVWDFGWQWALKGWHTDGAGGDIRLQMHATDPDLLERKLGHPASEGCVRLSSSMNRFLDGHGVLDADYEHAAVQDVRYRALLLPSRSPAALAGRLVVVIDTRLPIDAPPTASLRPADWPNPPAPAPTIDTAPTLP